MRVDRSRRIQELDRETDTYFLKKRQLEKYKLLLRTKREAADKRRRHREQEIQAAYKRIEALLQASPSQVAQLREQLSKGIHDQTGPLGNLRLGERLMVLGHMTSDQLIEALQEQSSRGGRIGDILVEKGFVTDAQIQELLDRSFRRLLLGESLIRSGDLTVRQLRDALSYQKRVGGDIGEILLTLGFVHPEQLYRALATQNQIGRLITYDDWLVEKIKMPEAIARRYQAVVIRRTKERCIVAVQRLLHSQELEDLAEFLETPTSQVLASPWEMEKLWDDCYHQELLNESTDRLKDEQPENSASKTLTFAQKVIGLISACLLISALVWQWFDTLVILNIAIQILYFSITVTKFVIILLGSKESAQLRFTDKELSAINPRDLPMYTILVPMYRESAVLPRLIRHLNALDYPKNKLDIRLLIEEDDHEAQQVIDSLNLPHYFQMIVVPDGQPKTKPKACNYGLINARGAYVVIYDAEDRPDPDQLKKVCLAFAQSPENTACIQAKLNYFNSNQNLLTRFFTQEYSNWFELLLPGVMKANFPIPLGGTSNHFKTAILKQLGAWDPYNVTEDADLGIRLYKQNYTTQVVDSRTLEEANSRYHNWIRQRSRWIKGYMQTWLVHMRHPLRLYREIGLKGFLGAQFMLLQSPVLPLMNPIFWSLLVIWYATHAGWIPQFFPGLIYYLAAVQLLVGNFLFIYSNMTGTYWVVHELHQRNERWLKYSLVKYALLTPLYWLMMSISSYKALWQLIRKPFYWEKTVHGFDRHPSVHTGDISK
ncbi:MAG: glycosyltransferase family 2 protein [Sporolactobacillus sp.]